jgi:hypothetical protein
MVLARLHAVTVALLKITPQLWFDVVVEVTASTMWRPQTTI